MHLIKKRQIVRRQNHSETYDDDMAFRV